MGAGMITQTEISTVHTIFNIGTTLLLFPVSDWIIKLARKLQKEEDGVVDESRVLLDEKDVRDSEYCDSVCCKRSMPDGIYCKRNDGQDSPSIIYSG